MERLTMRNDRGMAFWRDLRSAGGGYRMIEDKKDQGRLDRLAAYEDAMPLERAQELAQAEKDGRLVVMPFKAGDTVYRVATTSKYVNSQKNTPYIKKIQIKPENAHRYISEIWKTVFPTRDAAEAELERRIGDNDGTTDL